MKFKIETCFFRGERRRSHGDPKGVKGRMDIMKFHIPTKMTFGKLCDLDLLHKRN